MQHATVHISEQGLIDQLIAGDPSARETLYDKYAAALYGIVLQIVPSRDKADDVLVKVFNYIFLHIPDFRASGHYTLFAWMMRITRKMAVEEAPAMAAVSNEVALRDNSLMQRFAVSLPEEMYQAFRLCYYKGLQPEAVARMLGSTPEEVSFALKQSMVAFRKFLKDNWS